MPNAQEWLNYHYSTKDERVLRDHLIVNQRNLSGALDLTDFINLETLNCSDNQLKSLNLTGLTKLKFIACDDNLLTNLNFLDFLSTSQPKNLTYLNLSNNDFASNDLSIFSNFVNLEKLLIGNTLIGNSNEDEEKLELGVRGKKYNRFHGSLKLLQNLKRLKRLDISRTDVNDGVEYLPDSLQDVTCYSDLSPASKVNSIREELKQFLNKILLKQLGELSFLISPNLVISQEVTAKEIYEKVKKLEMIKKFEFNGLKLLSSDYFSQFLQIIIPNEKQRDDYLRKGLCDNCYRINTSLGMCQVCNEKKLDKLIPYEEFTEIEEIAKGGFGTIYKAKFKKLIQQSIALKTFHNSKNFSREELLRESANYQMFEGGIVSRCLGVTQDEFGNYAMVMMYLPDGNLRDYLRKNPDKSIEDRFDYLVYIIAGLSSIHEKNLIHRDFHLGNVLAVENLCLITDLGLSADVYEQEDNEKVMGVLPFVAPEILKGEKYTKASDIYAFGMIMYEVLTGRMPFAMEDWRDDKFKKKIVYDNLRPKITIDIPLQVKEIVNECWRDNPSERPTAEELFGKIWSLRGNESQLFIESPNYGEISLVEVENRYSERIRKLENMLNTGDNINLSEIIKIRDVEEKLNSIKKTKNNQQQILFDKFISLRKKYKRDENNQEIKKELGIFEKELKKDQAFKEIIQEIKSCCDKIIELEKESEQQVLIEQIDQVNL